MKQPISAKAYLSISLLLAALGAGGCIPFGDPGGPGAEGTISLGAGVTKADFTTLHMRAVPDDSQAPFDAKVPSFPGASANDTGTWQPQTEVLAVVTFPRAYSTREVLGTTPHEHWRLFVWLSKSEEEGAPTSGEPYGTTTFSIDGCGAYGGFCGTTSNVDVALDKIAPATP